MNKTIEQVTAEADKKIPRDEISTRDGGGGKKLSYLESHYVIARMNEVFGTMGWDAETVEMRQVNKDGDKPAYVSKVRLTAVVKTDDGGYMKVSKEGYGFGSDKSGLNPHEMAVKEAESDAFKRAARQFGMSLGLALYDKTQENVEDAPKVGLTDVGGLRKQVLKESVAQAPKPAPAQTVAPAAGTREATNTLITAEANVALAKAGPKNSAERAAKLAELKALTKTFGANTKEELTDAKAKELLAKLKEMNNG